MDNIIRQIEEHSVYNIITRIHDKEDVQYGDITERLEEYQYYNHIADYDLSNLNLNSFQIDEDKLEDIIFEIKENGISTMPKIVISETGEIIDGLHRAIALKKLGYDKIDILQGTNTKYEPVFKKELFNETLQIYKIYNNFGSISIMENAKYSPADNSVFEFLVNEEYRGLGVGTELLREAMKQYPNLGAQVSSLASLKVFLECGFEPHDLKTIQKTELDTTSFDFKTFNKCPELLDGQAAMYRQSIEVFNKKFEEAKELFMENGQSLYFNDTRKQILKQTNKRNIRP